MCVFLISPVPMAKLLTSELIDTPVFHNLAPGPIKYQVSVPIPSPNSELAKNIVVQSHVQINKGVKYCNISLF